ncbi:MAG TPA: ABC transporter ATPase, partial [Candidatus Kapabacteria bacterium]|nr:ABC transporter ATPase [Candidatus Kapabacteria bacterium]
AHHVPVQAARELHFNQFLIIAANPDVTAPSGCSIDDMTRAIKSLGAKFGVDFFGAMKIFYRDGENIRMVTRGEFKQLATSGDVDAETVVFDHSLTTLGELREGKWEVSAAASWHSALLPEVLAL